MKTVNLAPIHEFKYSQIPNHGFRFALLDPEGRALHSPFMCKDYLQDIFWSEYTGNSGEQYGLTWAPGRVTIGPTFDLAIDGGEERMCDKAAPLQEFLNHFETALGFPPSVVHETKDPHVIVVTFPREWTETGPLVSAFTSCIRIAGQYTGGDPIAYLKTLSPWSEYQGDKQEPPKPPYMRPELGRLVTVRGRLAALLAGKRPTMSWTSCHSIYVAHCTGIVGDSSFPMVEI